MRGCYCCFAAYFLLLLHRSGRAAATAETVTQSACATAMPTGVLVPQLHTWDKTAAHSANGYTHCQCQCQCRCQHQLLVLVPDPVPVPDSVPDPVPMPDPVPVPVPIVSLSTNDLTNDVSS